MYTEYAATVDSVKSVNIKQEQMINPIMPNPVGQHEKNPLTHAGAQDTAGRGRANEM